MGQCGARARVRNLPVGLPLVALPLLPAAGVAAGGCSGHVLLVPLVSQRSGVPGPWPSSARHMMGSTWPVEGPAGIGSVVCRGVEQPCARRAPAEGVTACCNKALGTRASPCNCAWLPELGPTVDHLRVSEISPKSARVAQSCLADLGWRGAASARMRSCEVARASQPTERSGSQTAEMSGEFPLKSNRLKPKSIEPWFFSQASGTD